MSEMKQSLDLAVLEKDYEIVGEIGGSGNARTYTATRKDAGAKRRDDQSGVLISVATTPEGDEGNALSHLAADTKLLAGLTHRRLMPVLEGRWVGTDAFAVVTPRTTDSTLAQKLVTGEQFSNTRIAAILREVNGLLEWAREHKVVHRTVTPDRIYLEPKTDRVRVSFGVAAIPRIQTSDSATEDARTVVRLAIAMLTGSADPATQDIARLTELRSDLPEQLRETTAALLDEKRSHTPADVSSFLALIGMADSLYAGETEAERIRAEVMEEQRVEREKLANERMEFEQVMSADRTSYRQTMETERANFEQLMAEKHAELERLTAEEHASFERMTAKEHADFERLMADERAKLAKEKDELQRAVTAERAALVAKREELERTVEKQRAELVRVAADDRRQIEALRAEIKRAGELEVEKKRDAALEEIADTESTLDDSAFAAPLFVAPAIAPIEELAFDDDTALMRDDDDGVEAVVEPDEAAVDAAAVTTGVVPPVAAERKKWIVPAALVGLVALIGISAVALGRRQTPAEPVQVARPAPVAQAPAAVPPSIVPLPAPGIVDSSAGSVARDSAPPVVVVKPKPKRIVRDTTIRRDSATLGDSIFTIPRGSQARRDSLARRDSAAKRDTVVKPDAAPGVRR